MLTFSSAGLVWSQPNTPAAAPANAAPAQVQLRDDQVQLLARTLADAEQQGFRKGEFVSADLEKLLASKDAAEHDRGVAMLQRAAIAYAKAQHGGRVPTSAFPDEWSIEPAAYDAKADFNFAVQQDKLAQWLASLPPPFERYRALQTALIQYRAIEAKGGWEPISAGPALKPGMSDQRVIQLRKRLAAENPPGAIDVTSPVYDPALAAAVANAQARYGLDGDSVVGPGALKAFNVPVEDRIGQIAANMERWRWMARAFPKSRIEVNIAAAHLDVYDQNNKVMEMKAVVGAPDKRTPMLKSEIHSVVLNPPWNVPTSIASKEILPKGRGYMARKGFTWVSNGSGAAHLQQKPGPGNSLGRIKFDFNNPFGVYLHDTNAKAAFGRDARSVSHGCVRVEKPQDLALLLLHDANWDQARLEQTLADMDTVRAPAPTKMPVMLLYWTAFAGADGQVNFRDDVYGWDDQLLKLIDAGKISA